MLIPVILQPSMILSEVIPLHISIRPNEDAIVFNSLIRDKWDHEERSRLPFEIQSLVLIDVKFDYTGFLVTINDEWLKMYEYRYPVTSANFLTIKGDCSMRSVSIFEEKGEETIKAAEYQQQETEETEKEEREEKDERADESENK
ncbi:hypothetical protein GCK72_022462 [Caenorhabditis remanei]|uniref:Galectin n=1 Tax=Caenorhabditis remanei TaxID=31234 RepID=A0A6A5FUF2_CAERE|nr:hypothetical protein GCK72_022462 [Caenorhabditis remanei]KAF1746011.1 hypothetical protein GCK72_022462 [Caenorhabditis remanei]